MGVADVPRGTIASVYRGFRCILMEAGLVFGVDIVVFLWSWKCFTVSSELDRRF